MINMNEDITIRRITKNQRYDGIIVQSAGNLDDLFKLFLKDGEWFYIPLYSVPERKPNNYHCLDDEDKKPDLGDYIIIEIPNGFDDLVDDDDLWYQTLYTDKVDKIAMRERKLDELGI